MGYRWVETRGEKEKPAIDRMGVVGFFNVVVVYGQNDRADSVEKERFLCLFKDLVGLAIPSPRIKMRTPIGFYSLE